jgi:carboxyl-terminal processing protease
MPKILLIILILNSGLFGQKTSKISKPEKDFEKFWTTFKDKYAFFQLKGVDWDSSYQKYRPLVSKKMKEKDLLEIFSQMVEPLRDGHITISKGDEIKYKYKKPSGFKKEFNGIEKQFWQTVDTTLFMNEFRNNDGVGPIYNNQNLFYFYQSSDISYLRITRCFAKLESLFDDKKEVEDTKLMLGLLDSLINLSSSSKGLIIDLRGNGGGHGGLEMASRFIKSKSLTHYKAIKQKGGYGNYTEPEPQYISPHNGNRYLNKLIILTNDRTASSAEDFTISLYNQDNVTTLGTNTSGMLSDMYEAQLSNNISFTLSNQVYYSIEKEILEEKGVPVHIYLPNQKIDIQNKKDPVVVKALETIRKM